MVVQGQLPARRSDTTHPERTAIAEPARVLRPAPAWQAAKDLVVAMALVVVATVVVAAAMTWSDHSTLPRVSYCPTQAAGVAGQDPACNPVVGASD